MVLHGHPGDLEAYLVADVAFHRTLLEASGNEMSGPSATWSPRCSPGAPTTT